MKEFDCINDMYYSMIYDIMRGPNSEYVYGTKEIRDSVYRLNNIDNTIIGIRNISQRYCAAELLWYLMGDNSKDFIGRYASMWNNISDDGKTNNSAYGYIIKYKHGFNQLDKIVELLKSDINSRRAVININVPNENVIETKDEMCTIALQFLVRNNKVNLSVIMRSNDILRGFPFDVVAFTEWQKYVADKLNLEYGSYTHHAISLHAYERDFDKMNQILDSNGKLDSHVFKLNHKELWDNYEHIYNTVNNNYDENDKDLVVREFYKYNIFEDVH